MSRKMQHRPTNEPAESTIEPSESTKEPNESTNEPGRAPTNPGARKILKKNMFLSIFRNFPGAGADQKAKLPNEPAAGLRPGTK